MSPERAIEYRLIAELEMAANDDDQASSIRCSRFSSWEKLVAGPSHRHGCSASSARGHQGREARSRRYPPPVSGRWSTVRAVLRINGRNKKSVVLDLNKVSARSVLGELIARCDVLINSLRPGTMEKWGFTEESLKASLPGLVVVYVSAFGRTGPKASEGGYDPIAQGSPGP